MVTGNAASRAILGVVLSHYGALLDQVRFAISSRRAVLTGHGNAEAKPGAQSRRRWPVIALGTD